MQQSADQFDTFAGVLSPVEAQPTLRAHDVLRSPFAIHTMCDVCHTCQVAANVIL